MHNDQLLTRIGNAALRATAERAFEIAERFAARRQALDADTRFSESGRSETLAAELADSFGPQFRLARQALADARAAIDARRAKITLPAIDPKDVVAQLQRMERRAHVASLDPAERTKLLFNDETDARIIDAVLADAPELSGLPRDRHVALLDQRLHQLHGPALEAMERDEADLAEAEAAIKVASNDMRSAFDPKSPSSPKFDAIMTKVVVPWLVDLGGGRVATVKIDPATGQASYPAATEAEKAVGKFFKDRAEFEAQAA